MPQALLYRSWRVFSSFEETMIAPICLVGQQSWRIVIVAIHFNQTFREFHNISLSDTSHLIPNNIFWVEYLPNIETFANSSLNIHVKSIRDIFYSFFFGTIKGDPTCILALRNCPTNRSFNIIVLTAERNIDGIILFPLTLPLIKFCCYSLQSPLPPPFQIGLVPQW